MNIQALMKQAQKMQKDMLKEKEAIDNMTFTEKHSIVEVSVNGNKNIQKITIDKEMELEKEDLEMLEDAIMIAINNAFKKVDEQTEKTMGKYGQRAGHELSYYA